MNSIRLSQQTLTPSSLSQMFVRSPPSSPTLSNNSALSPKQRGHMVPAADAKQSQLAMQETFALTNIAPQVGEGFNRHCTSSFSDLASRHKRSLTIGYARSLADWAYLEQVRCSSFIHSRAQADFHLDLLQFCRSLTTQFEDVYVFTVPLFLPKQSPDGKWHVVRSLFYSPLFIASQDLRLTRNARHATQTYEMIAATNQAPTSPFLVSPPSLTLSLTLTPLIKKTQQSPSQPISPKSFSPLVLLVTPSLPEQEQKKSGP